jgi:hypothetical protein
MLALSTCHRVPTYSSQREGTRDRPITMSELANLPKDTHIGSSMVYRMLSTWGNNDATPPPAPTPATTLTGPPFHRDFLLGAHTSFSARQANVRAIIKNRTGERSSRRRAGT